MEDNSHDKDKIKPIIHLATAMAIYSDSNKDSNSDSFE